MAEKGVRNGIMRIIGRIAALGERDHPDRVIRLLLVGASSVGKSSAANTIFGSDKFRGGSDHPTTKCIQFETERHDKIKIQVTDTPGLRPPRFGKSEDETLLEGLGGLAPGPHAIVLVARADMGYADTTVRVYQHLKELLGEHVKKFVIFVFVGMDLIPGMAINEVIREAPTEIQRILDEVGGRCVGFSNLKPWKERKTQGDYLVGRILELKRHNSEQCYTRQSTVDSFIGRRTGKKGGGALDELVRGSVLNGTAPFNSRRE